MQKKRENIIGSKKQPKCKNDYFIIIIEKIVKMIMEKIISFVFFLHFFTFHPKAKVKKKKKEK